MTFSDNLFMRLQGYAKKVGVSFGEHSIDEFAGSPADIPDCEKTKSPMHSAFYGNTGTTVHKWRGYLEHYDGHLRRFQNTPVRVLEIGVYRGGSLTLWRNYFGSEATIFGIDIDPLCKQYDGVSGSVRIGSQADPAFLTKVVAEMGGVDVVIDDGSHIAQHQRASFEALFPVLNLNGVYICEDTITSYFRGYFGGGFRRKTNIIEMVKLIVDDLNADFHGRPQSIQEANRNISGVHFYAGMIVIEKSRRPRPSHMKIPPEHT